jgi:GT2 family glycosyltransferase
MSRQVTFSTPAGAQQLTGWRKISTNPDGFEDCVLAVPTYCRPAILTRLLERIVELPDRPAEIVVVDGSPNNDVGNALTDWAKGRELPYELVYVKSPAGLTLQRNVSIDAIEGREFVFFLDDDCLPEPGYFRHIRQVFLDDKAREIGGVRGFLTNGIHLELTRLWKLRIALGLATRGEPGKYYDSGTSGSWNAVPTFSGIRPVDVLAGGASGYRREVFSKHRFSQFFYGYAQGEDLEFSCRIRHDWKLMVCGDAFVDHNHADGGRPAGFARGRMAMRNRYFIWKRHSPKAKALDRFKFWMDHFLIIAYNAASFVRKPKTHFLAYAWGTLYAMVECVFAPPQHDEPPARREFAFKLEPLRDGQASEKPVTALAR